MQKKRFYPSTPKSKRVNWNEVGDDLNCADYLRKPFAFNDERCDANFKQWKEAFIDEWHNNIAGVNGGNSISQYNDFLTERLSYAECGFLGTDSIINNAINKYANECLRRGGLIVIDESVSNADEIKAYLEKRLKELDFEVRVKEAIEQALIYGGSLVFFDYNAEDLSEPLYESEKIQSANKLQGLRAIPPYLVGASKVNTANPLNSDFMRPELYFVSGASQLVHYSRAYSLSFFNAPINLKPLYNFFGISLCQFMKNHVANADISR